MLGLAGTISYPVFNLALDPPCIIYVYCDRESVTSDRMTGTYVQEG